MQSGHKVIEEKSSNHPFSHTHGENPPLSTMSLTADSGGSIKTAKKMEYFIVSILIMTHYDFLV